MSRLSTGTADIAGAQARPLAGGTDLLTLMKADLATPERLVAVRSLLPAGIAQEPEGVTVGAGTTLREIEQDALVAEPVGHADAAQPRVEQRPPRRRVARGVDHADVDLRLAQDLVDRFVRAGAVRVFVGPRPKCSL